MKIEELTYTVAKKVNLSLKSLYIIRSDIKLLKQDWYAIFQLKYSKTNIKYTRVLILLAVTKNSIYLILVLH